RRARQLEVGRLQRRPKSRSFPNVPVGATALNAEPRTLIACGVLFLPSNIGEVILFGQQLVLPRPSSEGRRSLKFSIPYSRMRRLNPILALMAILAFVTSSQPSSFDLP